MAGLWCEAGCHDYCKGSWQCTPVGAFLACGKAATAMVPGDHGTTYGGNPLVCAAANAVLDVFKEKNIVGHVKEVGAYLYEKLEELVAEYDCVIAHRGKGLNQGLEFNSAVGPVVTNALLEQHLVLIQRRCQHHPLCSAACHQAGRCGRDGCETEGSD